MKTLTTLLLLLLAVPCEAQWVAVQSRAANGDTQLASGIHLGYDQAGKAIVVCSGHQFRDWDQKNPTVDQTAATVIQHQVDHQTDFAELRLLREWQVRRPSPARMAERSPTRKTQVYSWRNGTILSGYWEPSTPTADGAIQSNIFTDGNYRGFMAGVTPGWSGAPVYQLPDQSLIGMIIASDGNEVVWVPIEHIRQNLSSPPGHDPDTVYVGVKKGCSPCGQFKRDYAQGEFRGAGVVFRVLELGSSEYKEVVDRIERAGYQAPQAAPWFWSPRCNCNPLVDYRGVPWLLAWLPPPLTPPHDSARVQRYQRQREEQVTSSLTQQIESRLEPKTEDLKARLEAALGRLDTLQGRTTELQDTLKQGVSDPRVGGVLQELATVKETLKQGVSDPRMAGVLDKLTTVTETLGVPATETAAATGLFASQAGVKAMVADAAVSAATAKWGAVGGPAAMAALFGASFLVNRWRRKRSSQPSREPGPPVSLPDTRTQDALTRERELTAQLRQQLAQQEQDITYRMETPDAGLLRMRKAMEAVSKEYPQHGSVIRMIERTYDLLKSGEPKHG